MTKLAVAAQLLVRATGVTQILLGMLFWAGIAQGLVPVHMIIGLVLVLGLWTLAAVGLRTGAQRGLAALAIGWGFVVPALGMTQEQLLPGNLHPIIQILHLVVGIAAMGMAETLAGRIRAKTVQPADA